MQNMVLAFLLPALPVCLVAQQPPQPDQNTRQVGVIPRGDHVMGFSQAATTHHFHLLKGRRRNRRDCKRPNDKASIDNAELAVFDGKPRSRENRKHYYRHLLVGPSPIAHGCVLRTEALERVLFAALRQRINTQNVYVMGRG